MKLHQHYNDSPVTIIVQKQNASRASSSILANLGQVSRTPEDPGDEPVKVCERNFCAEEHRISNTRTEIFPTRRPIKNMISSGSRVAALLPST